MVFRGKPSGACLSCRQRRIRCDQNPNGCGSCKRSKIACTGYRDVDQVRFVHHHKDGKQRHDPESTDGPPRPPNQIAKKSTFNLPTCSGKVHNETGLDKTYFPDWTIDLCPSVTRCMDDIAVSLFYGQFECLPGLLTKSSAVNDPLSALPACVKALGMVTCANALNAAEMNTEAKQYYSSALQKTNAALASPTTAHHDGTLLAVMLLTNFETMVRSDQWSFEAWSAHIRGSAALLALRGVQQFQTSDGRLLFMQASMNLVSHCLRSSHRIPAQIHDLTKEATRWAKRGSPENAIWTVHQARLYLADLYSDVARGQVEDPAAAVNNALTFDIDLRIAFERRAPRAESTPAEVSLQSWSTMQAWTSLAICRMILHLLVIKLLSPPSDDSSEEWTLYAKAQIALSSELLSVLLQALLVATHRRVQLTGDEHLFFKASSKSFRLLSPQAESSSAPAAVADQLLISSLCGSGFLDLSVGDDTGAADISWALLLVGHISNPSLYSANSAPQLLRFMGRVLNMDEALQLAHELDNL